MSDWTVRAATMEDLETIVDFNSRLAKESEDKVLPLERLRRGVTEILSNPARGRYFVALDGSQIAGQLSYTTEWSDWRDGEIWWIQSVYVQAEYRGRRVYEALHRNLETLARSTPGVIGLRLYVEKHNTTAQSAYVKAGLTHIPFHLMERLWHEELA